MPAKLARARRAAAIAAIVASVIVVVAAWAYFANPGSTTAAVASVGSVNAPANVTAQQVGADVSVGWAAATLSSGGAVDGYRVARSDGATVCGSPTPVAGLSCTDTSVPGGTYTYTVTAVFHSFTTSATSPSVTVALLAPVITSTPPNPSTSSAATFVFHSGSGSSPGSFECKLDNGSFSSCSSPQNYTGLADGAHTFTVHEGQGTSASPNSSYSWAVDTAGPTASFAFAGGLFWANNSSNAIGHSNLDGSGVNQHFVTGATSPRGTGVGGSFVYWGNSAFSAGDQVGRANLDGSGANQSLVTAPYVYAVTADSSHVYWTDIGHNSIGRANLDGSGSNQGFINGANGPVSVAVNGSYVYWANINSGTIGRANIDGSGANESFMTVSPSAQAVAADDSHLYFTTGNSIGRANLDGTGVNSSFITSAGGPQSLAVDAGHIYWGTAGNIGRANIDGSGATTGFITGGSGVTGVAVLPTPTNSLLNNGTLYYNGSAAGSATLVDSATDPQTGPASATFPAIATAGWTHPAETVTTGSGSPPTVTYTSSAFSWTANPSNPTGYAITSTDAAGNNTSTPLTFVNDSSGPTGGALSVGGAAATAGGSTTASTSAGFAIDTRTDYTEAQSATQSGLKSTQLTVQSESFGGGTCGAPGSGGPFTTPVAITGTTQPSGIVTDACYVYTLSATDNVGNTASIKTTVKVDAAAPVTTITPSPIVPNGSDGWYTTTPAFTLAANDTGSGVASTFYKIDGGTTQTYGSAVTISEGQHTVDYWSTDNLGNVESTHTKVFKVDLTAPTSTSISTYHADGSPLDATSSFDGTWSGTPAYTAGRSGMGGDQAFSFTGSAAQTVTMDPQLGDFGTRPFTISFSFKSSSMPGGVYVPLVSNRAFCADPPQGWVHISYLRNGMFFEVGGNHYAQAEVDTTLDDNQWHDVVAQRTATGLTLTIDGVTTTTTAPAADVNPATPIGINVNPCSGNPDNLPLTAAVDDLVIQQQGAGDGTVTMPDSNGAFLGANRIYFNGNDDGSFGLADAFADAGSGPASATFGAITTGGWTHAAETVTSGTASGADISYPSASFSWTAGAATPPSFTVTSTDDAGNTATHQIAFADDTTAPAGGMLIVNGTEANGGGSTSNAAGAGFAIDSRTDFAETQSASESGLGSSELTVQSASLTGGTCGFPGSGGPFILPTPITGTTQPPGMTDNACYTYTLQGTDKVGNNTVVSTTVKAGPADTDPPVTSITPSPLVPDGSDGWYTTTPTFTLDATDSGSGVASTFYKIDGGTTQTYSGPVAVAEGQHSVDYWSTDNLGNTEATSTKVFKVDLTAPNSTSIYHADGTPDDATGAFDGTWSGTPSYTAGRSGLGGDQAFSFTGSASQTVTMDRHLGNFGTHPFTISFSFKSSGIPSGHQSLLSARGYCGDPLEGWFEIRYGPNEVSFEVGYPYQPLTQAATLDDGQWHDVVARRTATTLSLTVDGVTSSVPESPISILSQTPVGINTSACLFQNDTVPLNAAIDQLVIEQESNGAVTMPVAYGASLSGDTIYYNGNANGSFALADTFADSGSGPASATFGTVPANGWAHAAETVTSGTTSAGNVTYPSAPFSWTAGAATPSSYTVTSTDDAGNTATHQLTFANDTTGPTGGALIVNGTDASAAGSESTWSFTPFSIDSRNDFTEAQSATESGLNSSRLTIQSTSLTAGTCGIPGSGGPFTAPMEISGTTQPAGIVDNACYIYTLRGTDNVGNTSTVSTTVKVTP